MWLHPWLPGVPQSALVVSIQEGGLFLTAQCTCVPATPVKRDHKVCGGFKDCGEHDAGVQDDARGMKAGSLKRFRVQVMGGFCSLLQGLRSQQLSSQGLLICVWPTGPKVTQSL